MGIRTIILILLALVIGYAVRRLLQRRRSRRTTAGNPSDSPGELVRCATCYTYIPRNHAVQKNGDYYCAGEHLRQ